MLEKEILKHNFHKLHQSRYCSTHKKYKKDFWNSKQRKGRGSNAVGREEKKMVNAGRLESHLREIERTLSPGVAFNLVKCSLHTAPYDSRKLLRRSLICIYEAIPGYTFSTFLISIYGIIVLWINWGYSIQFFINVKQGLKGSYTGEHVRS